VANDRIIVSIDSEGVADVRLNRPEKMNAVDNRMFIEVAAAGRELGRDRSLRAVVLSGEGRAFCAGLDTANFASMTSGSRDTEGPEFNAFGEVEGSPANNAQEFAWAWHEVPVPVIAAVHGPCFGAGIQLALAADIRFVAPDARLSIMEMRWGLIPDVAGTQTLRRLLPLDLIKELTYTARIVSGSDAVEMGLATHVSDTPREAALQLAREIAGRSPSAVRAAKRLLEASGLVSEAEGLALEAEEQRLLIGSKNQIEAVMSTLEKRDANYLDPE